MVLDRCVSRLLGEAEERTFHCVALVADRDIRKISREQVGLIVTLGGNPLGHKPCLLFSVAELCLVQIAFVAHPRFESLFKNLLKGVGKARFEIREALAEAGVRVVALAPSASASRGVLREEVGFESADTVAKFQKNREMQESARDGVILVDEASLLSTKDMLQLFETAESVDARIVLVGDRRQHRAVLAGEPLKLLEEKAGSPVAEVTEIMRQSGDYRTATLALSENRTEDGLDMLDRLGWIREVSDEDRYKELASAYIAAVHEKKRNGEAKTALVISPTHLEAAKIVDRGLEQGHFRGFRRASLGCRSMRCA